MSAKIHRLATTNVVKPWGRTDCPVRVGQKSDEAIGEIWFVTPNGAPSQLLVKYLFTSDRLSVQVHPDDEQARRFGMAGGKSECWYVLDAEPGATLGIGLRGPMDEDTLRRAALDGSLESMIDWKPVTAGSFYYIPAGTIHAIGGGVRLIEVQQNNDVTYRLYDYGRPRPLHLEEGIAVGIREPYPLPDRQLATNRSEALVTDSDAPFSLDSMHLRQGETRILENGPIWLVPINGSGKIDDEPWTGGECWLLEGGAAILGETDAYLFVARPNGIAT